MQLEVAVEGMAYQLCITGGSVSNPGRKTGHKATLTETYRDFLEILYENVR